MLAISIDSIQSKFVVHILYCNGLLWTLLLIAQQYSNNNSLCNRFILSRSILLGHLFNGSHSLCSRILTLFTCHTTVTNPSPVGYGDKWKRKIGKAYSTDINIRLDSTLRKRVFEKKLRKKTPKQTKKPQNVGLWLSRTSKLRNTAHSDKVLLMPFSCIFMVSWM